MPTLSDCHDLLLDLAPELRRGPLYVIPIPDGYPEPQETFAFSTRHIDALLRSCLDDWRGPGNAIVVVQPLEDDDLIGGLLHEAAHLLPWREPLAEDPTPERIAATREMLGVWASEIIETPRRCPHHGIDFVRTCCHLHFRAGQAGIDLPFPALRAGWEYQLPPTVQFARALGNEPAECLDLPFAEILSRPVPAAFSDLYQKDSR